MVLCFPMDMMIWGVSRKLVVWAFQWTVFMFKWIRCFRVFQWIWWFWLFQWTGCFQWNEWSISPETLCCVIELMESATIFTLNSVTSSTSIIQYVAKWYVRKLIHHYCSVIPEKKSLGSIVKWETRQA